MAINTPKLSRERKKFTAEYKTEAVRLSNDGTRSVAEVAAALGIHAGQLYRWRRSMKDHQGDAFPGSGKLQSRDEEVHRLRRDLKRVSEERDFLKKRRPSSPEIHTKIRVHQGEREAVSRDHDVSTSRSVEGRLLRMARSRALRTRASRCSNYDAHETYPPRQS